MSALDDWGMRVATVGSERYTVEDKGFTQWFLGIESTRSNASIKEWELAL